MLQDVDINNLELGDDEVMEGFDPGADPFAPPPPPSDGTYTAQATLQGGQYGGIKFDDEKKQYAIKVNARIVDPGGKFDNRPIFDTLRTNVRKDGSSSISGFLQGNKVRPETGRAAIVKQTGDVLAGTPQVKITTRWRSSYKDADGSYKDLFKGQKNHPSDGNGGFRHINKATLSDGTVVDVVAQAEIIKYAPVG